VDLGGASMELPRLGVERERTESDSHGFRGSVARLGNLWTFFRNGAVPVGS
jgi:hypothetical protein